jgi:ABC-type sugar transport system ATPase subunit
MLDRQLARERYESIKRRVSEAETLDAVESRRQGPTLEVLDMPSLPEQARVAFGLRTASFVGLAGLTGAGVALAWLWIRRLRQTPVPLIARA